VISAGNSTDLDLPAPESLARGDFDIVIRRLADDLAFGSDTSRLVGSGLEYASSRPYIPGDSERLLNWRLTARTGRAFVREYEALKRTSAYLVVDTSASMAVSSAARTKHDLAVWIASALGLVAQRRMSPVAVVGAGERSVPLAASLSRNDLWNALEPLRAHDFAEGTSLGERLRPDGVVSIMLYATYGRIGVEMLQGVFRELGLGQDELSVQLVKDAVATLPADHPLQSYLGIAPDLQFDAGLVDTFLHGRDRSYTTGECIELATAAGLVFDDWLLKAPYAVPEDPDNAFLTAIAQLPREQQWSVMERMHFRNGCHFFTACRADRPERSYRIDFAAERFLDYVPSLLEISTFLRAEVRTAAISSFAV
jgi:hypothetical protein